MQLPNLQGFWRGRAGLNPRSNSQNAIRLMQHQMYLALKKRCRSRTNCSIITDFRCSDAASDDPNHHTSWHFGYKFDERVTQMDHISTGKQPNLGLST